MIDPHRPIRVEGLVDIERGTRFEGLRPRQRARLDSPVVLMPLRLELRRFRAGERHRRVAWSAHDLDPAADPTALAFETHLVTRDQYWLRWYPDDCQQYHYVGGVRAEEAAAWQRFERARDRALADDPAVDATLGHEDRSHPGLARAWEALVRDVGPVRARHLARIDRDAAWHFDRISVDRLDGEDTPLERFLAFGLPLTSQPERMHLFTVRGSAVQPLITDVRVDVGRIRIGPDHLEACRWQTDFDAALSVGMAARVEDPELVARIDAADWLIAVGAADRLDSASVLTDLLGRANAAGELSLLAQDTPTNNVAYRRTSHAEVEPNETGYLDATLPRFPDSSRPEHERFDGELLAAALGVGAGTFDQMRGADLREVSEARAMRTIVGLACAVANPLLDRLGSATVPVFAHFLTDVAAAGPLPTLRIGSNPYGVLPVLSLRDYEPQESSTDARILRVARLLRLVFTPSLTRQTPMLADADERELYDTLVEILGRPAVSNRVDIRRYEGGGDPREQDPERLWCHLVAGPDGDTSYLRAFAMGDDMGDVGPDWPLLQRLLVPLRVAQRDWGEHPDIRSPEGLASPESVDLIAWLRYALDRVSGLSVQRLEILLLEALDLLSHRLDAWLTSCATRRLRDVRRESTRTGLGVFGIVEAPRGAATVAPTAEFLQAPSKQQALTAAVLKNASVHGSATDPASFRVNLSTERVRDGRRYFEAVRAGHSPAEILGTVLEEMLVQAIVDGTHGISELDILTLRERYPLTLEEARDEDGNQTAPLTLIDGSRFLDEDDEARFAPFRQRVAALQDAAADLAVFEACDQLFQGNAARAGGWLDSQEGTAPPPELSSVLTHRSGPMHSTRVSLLLGIPAAALEAGTDETSARVVASPELAWWAEQSMPDFDDRQILVEIAPPGASSARQVLLTPHELGYRPIDLVVGSTAELELRARYHVLARWQAYDGADPASPYAILGAFPEWQSGDGLLAQVTVRPQLETADSCSICESVEQARRLRDLLGRQQNDEGVARPVYEELPALADEAPAADPGELTERVALRSRRIFHRLGTTLSALARHALPLVATDELVRHVRDLTDRLGQLERRIVDLDPVRRAERVVLLASRFARALPPGGSDELSASEATLLSAALADAASALASSPEAEEDLAPARRRLTSLLRVLETRLDSVVAAFVDAAESDLDDAASLGILAARLPLPAPAGARHASGLRQHIAGLLLEAAERMGRAAELEPDMAQAARIAAVALGRWDAVTATLGAGTDRAATIRALQDRVQLGPQDAERLLDASGAGRDLPTASLALLTALDDPSGWSWPENSRATGLRALQPVATDLQRVADGEAALADVVAADHQALAQELLDGFGSHQAIDFETYFRRLLFRETGRWTARLEALTDGPALRVLRALRKRSADGSAHVPWTPSTAALDERRIPGGRPLSLEESSVADCALVRPTTDASFRLLAGDADARVYEDLRAPSPLDAEADRQGDTDWVYVRSGAQPAPALAALHVDEWEEGRPRDTEDHAIAFRFPSGHAEAPNVVLVAVPPRDSTEEWSPQLLANAVVEAIELSDLRMVTSRAVVESGLGSLLPAAVVGEDPDRPLFPAQPMLLSDLILGQVLVYAASEDMTAAQLSQTEFMAVRAVTGVGE